MIASRYADYMYGLLERVMEEIGPRESCSEEEKVCGRLVESEFGEMCDRVEVEKFACSPKAFLGFFPFLVLAYFAGVALYYVLPGISLIIAALCLGVLFFEVVRYHELIDRLFPRREGENIVGTVAPAGNIERRVIVSAHLDSAYEFKIWYWFKGFSVALMVVAFLAPLLLLAASLARTLAHSSGVPHGMPYFVLGIILIALAPVVGIFAFFHTSDVVPGAMDNMAGISVLAGLGKYLKEAAPEDKPKGSEVVLLATSSEEAGLRGAKRYVSKHKEDFTSVPTYGIFLDGICDENFLTVFTREVWPGARHDARLIELANSVASENGLSMKNGVLPVGATDAAAFSLAGVPSVALCCQDNSRLVPNYHTRLDTIDYVRPESMEVSLQIVIGMLNHLDTE